MVNKWFSKFGPNCAGCQRKFGRYSWVREVDHLFFHLACFLCQKCKYPLATREEYGFDPVDQVVLCKKHFPPMVGEDGM